MIDLKDFKKKNGRKVYGFKCSYCGEKGYKRKDQLERYDTHYCSLECSHKARVTRVEVPCGTCGKPTLKNPCDFKRSKSSLVFCSRSCSVSHSNSHTRKGKDHPNYKTGKSSYRKKALDHYEHKCHNPDCIISHQLEYIPVEMLDVDHIDNNRENNEIENLKVLCVWCHALKTRDVIVVDYNN